MDFEPSQGLDNSQLPYFEVPDHRSAVGLVAHLPYEGDNGLLPLGQLIAHLGNVLGKSDAMTFDPVHPVLYMHGRNERSAPLYKEPFGYCEVDELRRDFVPN